LRRHLTDTVSNGNALEEGLIDEGQHQHEAQFSSAVLSRLPYKSLLHMLETLYPTEEWVEHVPIRWLRQEEILAHLPQLVHRMERELKIEHPKEWLRVSEREFDQIRAKKIRTRFMEPFVNTLREMYPKLSWRDEDFRVRNKKSTQRWLLKCIQDLFPNDTIHEEKIIEVRESNHSPQQNTLLFESDIYVEQHSLLVDYHGEQHYKFIDGFSSRELEKRVYRDEQKRQLFRQNGYTYVSIPYWWDKSVSSLRSTLHATNPQLFQNAGDELPIPHLPPYNAPHEVHEHFGTPPPLIYPSKWDRNMDLCKWWCSPLLEGMRVIYMSKTDGPVLLTPEGRVVRIPLRLLEQIPNKGHNLDGELHSPHGLQFITSVIHLNDLQAEEWNNIRFRVYDIVNPKQPFEERQRTLARLVSPESTFCVLCEYQQIESNESLEERLSNLEQQSLKSSGDVTQGLLLKKPHSLYRGGSSFDSVIVTPRFTTQVLLLSNSSKAGQLCKVTLLNGKVMGLRMPCFEDTNLNNLKEGESILNVEFSHVNRSTGSLVDATIVSINATDSWSHLKANFDAHGDAQIVPENTEQTLRDALQWAVQHHDPQATLRDIRNFDLEEQTQILEDTIEKCAYIYATHEERLWLYSLFSLPRPEFDRVMKRAKQKKRNPSGQINVVAKNIIREWLKSHDFVTPNAVQKNELQRKTGLSRMQLNTQTQYLRDEASIITPEAREYLEQWMKQHDYKSPSSADYDRLQEHTNLSRSQLYTQVKLLKSPRQEVLQQHRNILLNWLKSHNFSLPNTQERSELQGQTGLSRNQINQQLNYLVAHHAPQADSKDLKEFVRNWLKKNDYRAPSKEEFAWLMDKTGWKRRLLKDQIQMMTPMVVGSKVIHSPEESMG